MAEGAQPATEFPVKRPREEEENGGASVEMEQNNGSTTKLPDCMSSVIPGWFSEISPMWPGNFLFTFLESVRKRGPTYFLTRIHLCFPTFFFYSF